jgi:NhaP-type Na+/H+ or K+/H+ antiporter
MSALTVALIGAVIGLVVGPLTVLLVTRARRRR